MFSRYGHLEGVPRDSRAWPPSIRGAQRLCAALFDRWDEAVLYRTLATLRYEVPVFESVDELRWTGPAAEFEAWCGRIEAEGLYRRAAARRLAADVS
jgi:hypothetical protein